MVKLGLTIWFAIVFTGKNEEVAGQVTPCPILTQKPFFFLSILTSCVMYDCFLWLKLHLPAVEIFPPFTRCFIRYFQERIQRLKQY